MEDGYRDKNEEHRAYMEGLTDSENRVPNPDFLRVVRFEKDGVPMLRLPDGTVITRDGRG